MVFASFCHFCLKVFAIPVITGFCHWFFPLWQKLANPGRDETRRDERRWDEMKCWAKKRYPPVGRCHILLSISGQHWWLQLQAYQLFLWLVIDWAGTHWKYRFYMIILWLMASPAKHSSKGVRLRNSAYSRLMSEIMRIRIPNYFRASEEWWLYHYTTRPLVILMWIVQVFFLIGDRDKILVLFCLKFCEF